MTVTSISTSRRTLAFVSASDTAMTSVPTLL